jgi:hypothetical protein
MCRVRKYTKEAFTSKIYVNNKNGTVSWHDVSNAKCRGETVDEIQLKLSDEFLLCLIEFYCNVLMWKC